MEAAASENKYLESQGVVVEPSPSRPPLTLPNQKSLVEAYILGLTLGFFGVHHFYLRRYGWGTLYLCTFGLLGVGYVVDLLRMPVLVKRANDQLGHPDSRKVKHLDEAYIAWLPFGLLGFHHFYLGKEGWGFVYMFTFGLFGVGWVIDGFRMKCLVDNRNKDQQNQYREFRELSDVYTIALSPLAGLLGFHHYYTLRLGFGFYYTFTLGGLGFGWLLDLFRLPSLVKDLNERKTKGYLGHIRLDDCYILLIPFGLFGLHHFYLKRPCWGVLYLCTLGLFGIGWIVDIFRLPFLVKYYNAQREIPLTQPGQEGVTNQGYDIPPGVYPYGGGNPAAQGPPQMCPQPNPNAGYHSQPGPVLPPYSAYPGPAPVQLPQGAQLYPQGYGTAGETSWSTINSSDFDEPPPYAATASSNPAPPIFQHETKQQTAPSAPPKE